MRLGEQERKELLLIHDQIVSACQYCAGKSCQVCTGKFEIYPAMVRANLPKLYWDEEISRLDDPLTAKVVSNYVKNIEQMRRKGCGLYLWGQTKGAGKSLAACVILKEALRRGYTGYFTTLSDLVTKCFNKMYDQQAQEEFKRNILDVDFLVLDDIGKEYKSEKNTFIDSAYDNLFRERYYSCRPILVTSNAKRTEVIKEEQGTFGQALLSLFREQLCDVFIAGRDRRGQNNAELQKLLYK